MNAELIGLISVLIITIGNSVHAGVKSYFDNRYKKNNENELSKRDIILTASLRDLEKITIGVRDEVKGLVMETDFEKVLRNSIRAKASQIVSLNFSLPEPSKNIVIHTARQIEDFAFLFYYSPYRNNSAEMEKYLYSDIQEKRVSAHSFMDNCCNKVKTYKKKTYRLSTFLIELNIFKHIELLILRLVENGLSKEDTIDLFVKFTDKYSEELIKAMIIFDTLEDAINIPKSKTLLD